ncbi:MAG: hypothetical protein ACLU38_15940 [Dysosmobacter sp.]
MAEKLVQAENVLFALRQRESTMLRCARFVTAGQQAFFRDGPRALRPSVHDGGGTRRWTCICPPSAVR